MWTGRSSQSSLCTTRRRSPGWRSRRSWRRERNSSSSAPITSTGNAHVKWFKQLKERRGREATGAFLVEGPRAIEQGVASGVVPVRVAYATRAGGAPAPIRAVLSALPAETALVEMEERVLGGIADTVHSQGVIAAFPLPAWRPTPADLRDRLVLVLDGVSDPGNVGTLLRSAAAADCGGVLLAPGCADRFNPKVVRASVGALFSVRSAGLEWSALGDLLRHIPSRYVTDTAGETVYHEAELAGGCAILVGNEAAGLGAQARSIATASLRIPIVGVESLNAAVAGSLLLFEAVRQRSLERPGASHVPRERDS